jgi:hypothetical protein
MYNKPLQPQDNLAIIQKALATAPVESEVAASFQELTKRVTTLDQNRILIESQTETSIISPFLMHIKTKLSLAAGTIAVVALVGFMTYSNPSPYLDLEQAALESESAYDLTLPEDSFGDLEEDFRDEPSIDAGSSVSTKINPPATSGPAPAASTPPASAPSTSNTVNVDTDIAALDSLFAEDDLDDSGLQSWYGDVSASENLTTQSYDF